MEKHLPLVPFLSTKQLNERYSEDSKNPRGTKNYMPFIP